TFLLDPLMYPPLGALHIASKLLQEGHEVKFFDLRDYQMGVENLVVYPQADLYGITASTSGYNEAVKIKNTLKKIRRLVPVVIGGSHASVRPEECNKEFDATIVGEGETSIMKVIDGARGIVTSPIIKDIDTLPYPARHLLRQEARVSYNIFGGQKYSTNEAGSTVTSTRGCPFECSYCCSPCIWAGKIRFRSPENFVGEIKEIGEKYGAKRFKFVDDNFPLKKQRIIDIMDLLEPMDIQFRCHTKTSLVNQEVLEA
ncbi:unnamed protein product, partial [marine sediment metagenome]